MRRVLYTYWIVKNDTSFPAPIGGRHEWDSSGLNRVLISSLPNLTNDAVLVAYIQAI